MDFSRDRQQPKTEYLTSLGTTLLHQGRCEEALKTFDKAVQLDPNDADLWRNLGNVLADAQRPADAILTFQQVLKLDPRHWDAANQCGQLLFRLGRLEEAVVYFTLCDQMQPNSAATLQMRGLVAYSLNRFEEGLADIRRAQAIDPANADLCNNLGVLLRRLGREEEALPWFDKALELRPKFPAVLGNKGFALTSIHRFAEAFAVYDELKAADPDNAEADYNMSLLHLLTGNFEAGWAAREERWKMPNHSPTYRKFSQPIWLGGESIQGKVVLIHGDEGLGDTLQFARYVPMVAARGARVILRVQDALQPLLSGLPAVAECLPSSAGALPAFDLHCPVMSLPLAFDTRLETIPSPTYLPPITVERVEAFEKRLGPHGRLRVGLVWSGNPKQVNDRNRSMPLRTLTHLLDVNATFVSLQKDPRPEDKALLAERTDIVDLTDHLTDFVETAALVSSLDLVITVCTSVAHLAATLGRPTWIMLPYLPDWRWLLDRDDSPWYPTARLFRQNATRDYSSVVDRVRAELTAIICAFERAKN